MDMDLKYLFTKIELINNKDVLKLGASLFIPIASPLLPISIAVTERDSKLKLTCLPACRTDRSAGWADRAVRSFRYLNRS